MIAAPVMKGLTITSLFSLIVCLIGLILTEDGTTVNNEDRKES